MAEAGLPLPLAHAGKIFWKQMGNGSQHFYISKHCWTLNIVRVVIAKRSSLGRVGLSRDDVLTLRSARIPWYSLYSSRLPLM